MNLLFVAMMLRLCFNRRGDSLGGAAAVTSLGCGKPLVFQSQGRFFGGCCLELLPEQRVFSLVSIAGAILWGVLRSWFLPPK